MEGEKPGMKAGTLEQGHMRRLCLLCCMAYFMSYLTRLDYAACMVEIQKSLQVGKDVVGLPVTACFASYGVGQLLCGFLGDRCRPQRMIFAGLLGSSVCNILAAWLPWMEAVTLVWCMNGFFQSMLWPPMVRIMAQSMDEAWSRRSCVLVSMASAAATILIYLCVPLCIRFSGWKTVFFLAAFLGAAASFVWIALTGKLECGRKPEGTEKGEEAGNGGDGKARSGGFFGGAPMVPILLAIALHGILRDGIITWMPTYMSEVFGMSSSGSILSAVALPICSVFSTLVASWLLQRLRSELVTGTVLFGTGALGGAVLLVFYNVSPAVCISMMTLITGCMYGVNLMLISRVPGHFARLGNVAAVSGILNAATYVGSSFSASSFGAVAENTGWLQVVLAWVACAVLGTLLLLSGIRRWNVFCRKT